MLQFNLSFATKMFDLCCDSVKENMIIFMKLLSKFPAEIFYISM